MAPTREYTLLTNRVTSQCELVTIFFRVFPQFIGNASASVPIGEKSRRFFVKFGKKCVASSKFHKE